jgi:glutaredoxin-like protein
VDGEPAAGAILPGRDREMALLSEDVAVQLKEEFARLQDPVRLTVFSQALADPDSEQVRRLVEEVASLHPDLSVEALNFVLDKDRAESLGVSRTPAVAIRGGEKDFGIRFYGLPSGYEFGTLVDAILLVSSGKSGLSDETRDALGTLDRPVHIQVFSTPTCPYCPRAVHLAYQFALESDLVSADGVEVTGFLDLARRYNVSSVPKTVLNDKVEFVGALPEEVLLEHVRKAAEGGGLVTV